MSAYYNENNKFAAEWLRNLIAAGHIAPGDVDERSIEDVRPDDLRGYTQCHFFAGIGGWPLALRLAGWDDSRPVWSGSCPCQPFSAAGKGNGFADERHLWPVWRGLIGELQPPVVFGEQVASKDANAWLDLVSADLETLGFAVGAVAFPSASVGAPHIRDRTYFVAHAAQRGRREKRSHAGWLVARDRAQGIAAGLVDGGISGVVADADRGQFDGLAVIRRAERDGQNAGRSQGCGESESRGDVRGMADAMREGSLPGAHAGIHSGEESAGTRDGEPERLGSIGERPGPTNGFWRAADWLLCRDEKWRPVEPGTFPLVDGLPTGMGKLSTGLLRLAGMAGLDAASLKRAKAYRVGALRGYGNAINPHQAALFIRAADEAMREGV